LPYEHENENHFPENKSLKQIFHTIIMETNILILSVLVASIITLSLIKRRNSKKTLEERMAELERNHKGRTCEGFHY
jgi:hypothetical protein